MDSMQSGTSWRDDSSGSGVAADQAASLNILRFLKIEDVLLYFDIFAGNLT